MDDDRTLDRRSFLGRASAAGLVGFVGLGSLRSRAGRDGSRPDGDGGLVGDQDGGGTGGNGTGDGGGQGDGGQDGGLGGVIDFFQAVLPAEGVLESRLVNRLVVVGGQIQPGERPPPVCFPGDDRQWFARDAVVVDPTETTGLFGGGDGVGGITRTRAHLERDVEPDTVYRVSGGGYCEEYALVTVHELPEQLSGYVSADVLEELDGILEDVENATTGNGNGTAPNGTAANGTAANGTAPNRIVGDGA